MGEVQKKLFGQEIKALRHRYKESLAEVSGAVEIDAKLLGEIETGEKLPSEDIVLLLISHFSLREDEALRLWRLAGFDKALNGVIVSEGQNTAMPFSVEDNRILYTDMVHVSANNYGVIINFLQGLGGDGKPNAVARIGMSREHAKSIIEVLTRTLNMAGRNNDPKKLSDGKK